VSAGEHEVSTDCGPLRGLAPAVTRMVAEDVVSEAEALLAAYRADFRLEAPPTEPGSSAAGGQAWSSPVLGTLQWIPAGSFYMGSPPSEAYREDDETLHRVTLTSGFWMMEREVTQEMWQRVMGSNPSTFSGCDDCPVEKVTWHDAVAFAERLSAQEGVTYRLPTEAEWEYAARGGESTRYAGSNELSSVAWTEANSGGRTHPGCQKARNGYGLCDMTGNVSEWTGDWDGDYPSGAVTDPTGPQSGSFRVYRGGGWEDRPRYARVATRFGYVPSLRYDYLGLRLVRTIP